MKAINAKFLIGCAGFASALAGVCGFAGIVAAWALVAFVVPAAVIPAMITARLIRRPAAALLVCAIVAIGWAELANILSGETNGPVARSSFAVGLAASAAVAAARTRLAPTFPIFVLLIFWYAGTYGFDSAFWVVAVTAVSIGCLLLEGQPTSASFSRVRWRRSVGVIITVSTLVAVFSAVTTIALSSPVQNRPQISIPPTADVNTSPGGTELAAQSDAEARETVTKVAETLSSMLPRLLLGVVLLTLLALLLLTVRVGVIQLRWRRMRAVLQQGSSREQLVGAWCWARLVLSSFGSPVPAATTPDTLYARRTFGIPHQISRPLVELAELVRPVAYSTEIPVDADQATEGWRLALEVERLARQHCSRRIRLTRHLTSPAPIESSNPGRVSDVV